MKDQTKIQDAIMGRIPPQDIEIEMAVLGALILERDAISRVELSQDVFYQDRHGEIFRAVEQVNARGENVDMLTVIKQLKNSGKIEEIGGPIYISELTRNVASAVNIEQHCMFLIQSYIRRELIRISSEIMQMAYDQTNDIDDIMQLYDTAVSSIDSVVAGKKKGRELRQVIKDLSEEIERRHLISKKGGITGVTTGFAELDRITSGWQPNWLVVFAARPAMGKTAIGINAFAKAAAQRGHWVNIFSLEMEDITLAERLVLGSSGIDPNNMRSGKLEEVEWMKYNRAVSELESLPIFIDDTPFVRISRIRNIARSNRKKGKCDLIVIDYLQLANAGSESKQANREQQVAEMSRQLKALAKELSVPIILLSQLSRDVEKRGGTKRPTLSDLRESGAIEQDADMVIFPWRPSYYGIQVENVSCPEQYGELIISKNRHGKTADIKFWHDRNMTAFYDNSPEVAEQYQGKFTPVNYYEPF